MEVAVADVADNGCQHAGGIDVLARLQDALGKPRDRYADVGRPALSARLHRQVGEVGVVARLPQLRPILLPTTTFDICAAVLSRALTNQLSLLAAARLGAVEPPEPRRLSWPNIEGRRVR